MKNRSVLIKDNDSGKTHSGVCHHFRARVGFVEDAGVCFTPAAGPLAVARSGEADSIGQYYMM